MDNDHSIYHGIQLYICVAVVQTMHLKISVLREYELIRPRDVTMPILNDCTYIYQERCKKKILGGQTFNEPRGTPPDSSTLQWTISSLPFIHSIHRRAHTHARVSFDVMNHKPIWLMLKCGMPNCRHSLCRMWRCRATREPFPSYHSYIYVLQYSMKNRRKCWKKLNDSEMLRGTRRLGVLEKYNM